MLSVMLVLRRSLIFEVPLLGKSVPTTWMFFLLPLLLAGLWLQFGYLLDEVIQDRINCSLLLTELGQTESNYISSPKSLFNDAGLVDGWFLAFVKAHHSVDAQYAFFTSLIFGFVVGGFLGATHACIFGLLLIGRHRFRPNGSVMRWFEAAYVFIFFIILLSHFLFAYGGHNQNWISL